MPFVDRSIVSTLSFFRNKMNGRCCDDILEGEGKKRGYYYLRQTLSRRMTGGRGKEDVETSNAKSSLSAIYTPTFLLSLSSSLRSSPFARNDSYKKKKNPTFHRANRIIQFLLERFKLTN